MMYICLECGEVFENLSRWTEPHGEALCGCPYCKGAVEEAHQCKSCGEYFLEEDLWNGFCEDCAKDEINYESALRYFKSESLLREFFIVWYWQICSSAPDTENEEVDNLFVELFNQKVNYDKETGKTVFLKQLQEYILEDIYNWTEFLAKEVSANENSKD